VAHRIRQGHRLVLAPRVVKIIDAMREEAR
jgi:hypothetical protein